MGEGACGRESRGCGVAGLVGASASGPASPSPRPPAWPLALLPRVRFFSRPGGTDPLSSRAGSWLSYLAAGRGRVQNEEQGVPRRAPAGGSAPPAPRPLTCPVPPSSR